MFTVSAVGFFGITNVSLQPQFYHKQFIITTEP